MPGIESADVDAGRSQENFVVFTPSSGTSCHCFLCPDFVHFKSTHPTIKGELNHTERTNTGESMKYITVIVIGSLIASISW
jgi:hypothetical protein